MELDMPITRVLLKSACGKAQMASQALTVQPAQVLSSGNLPTQLDELPAAKPDVTKICDSNKYKMSVARRNERERKRVQNVNRTFDTLRRHVQGYRNANKKMSKVETLRCAAEYIRELQTILRANCDDEQGPLDSPRPISSLNDSTMGFEYQMPVTPNSQPDVAQTIFDFVQPLDSPKSNIASSPLSRSPLPAEETGAVATRHEPASPLPCGNILAACLQMPPAGGCTVVVKQEPNEFPSDAFDLNGNATITDGSDNLLDEQSYSKLAAALQHHGHQLNLSLCTSSYIQLQQLQQ